MKVSSESETEQGKMSDPEDGMMPFIALYTLCLKPPDPCD